MSNEIQKFKESIIDNYVYNIDPNRINVDDIKRELKQLLNEEPGIHLEYDNETIILEDGKSSKNISELKGISVYYSYDVSVPDGKGGYIDVPRFSTKKYILK